MSYETRYAAMKRQEADRRASTPEARADRERANEIRGEVTAEMARRFPGGATADNATEYARTQEALFAVLNRREWPDAYTATDEQQEIASGSTRDSGARRKD